MLGRAGAHARISLHTMRLGPAHRTRPHPDREQRRARTCPFVLPPAGLAEARRGADSRRAPRRGAEIGASRLAARAPRPGIPYAAQAWSPSQLLLADSECHGASRLVALHTVVRGARRRGVRRRPTDRPCSMAWSPSQLLVADSESALRLGLSRAGPRSRPLGWARQARGRAVAAFHVSRAGTPLRIPGRVPGPTADACQ